MKTTKQTASIVVIVLALLVLVSGNAFSQKQKIGIKGGVNTSNIITDGIIYANHNSKLGFDIFASYDFYNNKYLSLSAETGFNQKGFKYDIEETNKSGNVINTTTADVNLNYLDISFNGKFLVRGKSASPYFSLTPTLGVYLGHSQSSSTSYDSLLTASGNTIFDSLETVAFGVKLGLGIELYSLIKNVPVIFEIRFNPDIIDAYNKNSFSFRNTQFEFNAGVKF